MTKFSKRLIGLVLLTFSLVGCEKSNEETSISKGPTPYQLQLPAHFPAPTYDIASNPLTQEGVKLGMHLFYDGRLSRTNMIGCGTCHQQQAAFTHHGHDLSHGVDDLLGTRNSLAIQNLAWNTSFFWDGGVPHLDLVSFAPIANPVEMDEKVPQIIDKLKNTPMAGDKYPVNYPNLFKQAFGTEDITTERIMQALSQYMLTLISATSKYDYYLMGDSTILNTVEKRGLHIFEQKCASCHQGVLQTDYSFRNNGLLPTRINDQGRYEITGKEEDRYKFKVPSLRNVAITAPYMHDGRYYTLQEVLDHYSSSIPLAIQQNEALHNTLDPILKRNSVVGIPLNNTEKTDLIAFLRTLSDDNFVTDPRHADPGIGNAL